MYNYLEKYPVSIFQAYKYVTEIGNTDDRKQILWPQGNQ